MPNSKQVYWDEELIVHILNLAGLYKFPNVNEANQKVEHIFKGEFRILA